jgi:hemerythrin-like domain-containing protein
MSSSHVARGGSARAKGTTRPAESCHGPAPAWAKPELCLRLGIPASYAFEAVMDILDTLHQEHESVRKLLKDMVETDQAKRRTALFSQFRTALVKHERAEERAFYEPLGKSNGRETEIEAKEGFVEHALADMLIEQLKRARNKSTTDWTARIKVLRELIEHHIHEEERDFFPSARQHFSEAERAAMNANFESFKKKVKA